MPRKATTKVRTVKRDTHGLIVDSNVNYIFNEDGFVDILDVVIMLNIVIGE